METLSSTDVLRFSASETGQKYTLYYKSLECRWMAVFGWDDLKFKWILLCTANVQNIPSWVQEMRGGRGVIDEECVSSSFQRTVGQQDSKTWNVVSKSGPPSVHALLSYNYLFGSGSCLIVWQVPHAFQVGTLGPGNGPPCMPQFSHFKTGLLLFCIVLHFKGNFVLDYVAIIIAQRHEWQVETENAARMDVNKFWKYVGNWGGFNFQFSVILSWTL